MRQEFKFWLIFVGMFLVLFSINYLVLKPNIEITTAECPALSPVIKKVQMDRGWQCEEPERYMDLLQPSGLWINKDFHCWKLETPIEEYRIQECNRTGDNYWCSKI